MILYLHALAVKEDFQPEVWQAVLKQLVCADNERFRALEAFNRTLAIIVELFEIGMEEGKMGELKDG
jgi:hypothetical protein